jgi:cobalt-zinc-cadmium efflux system membrane fusion protein
VGLISAVLLSASCTNSAVTQEVGAYTIKNDTVYVHSSSEGIMQKAKFAEVSELSEQFEIITAGRIQAIPTQFAYVAPPFAGRIAKCHVRMGQHVTENMPLFEIISPEYTAMQKAYFQAEAERELARKDLVRKEELLANEVAAAKEYEEALKAMKQADKEFENAQASLRTYHVNTDKMVFGEPLVIRSPITGNLIENNIVTGQYISGDADPVALVANLNDVWLSAQVKEKDIRFIGEGDEMHIHVDALPGKIINGKVYHIEEMVDEDTRSIRVITICENRNEELKLGMYASMHFYGQPQNYRVVPEKAILQGEKHSYVLVQLSPDVLVRRAVKVDFTKDGKAFVSEGLAKGETVVGEGGYYFQ